MPLGGAIAINFSAPLFATLFAALWLKEKVGLARACALVVGFLGVLLVAAPGADSFRIGALFALGNAVLFGSVTAAVRGMTATESAETLTMYQMVFLLVFFAVALPVVRLHLAERPRTSTAMLGERPAQRLRPILVDALAVARAARGGRAVLLFLAGVGDRARLPVLGRHPDACRCSPARRSWSAPGCSCSGTKAARSRCRSISAIARLAPKSPQQNPGRMNR